MVEVSNSNPLLLQPDLCLSESSSKEPWYTEGQALADEGGPLDQYKLVLQQLLMQTKPANGMRKLANALVWTFVKGRLLASEKGYKEVGKFVFAEKSREPDSEDGDDCAPVWVAALHGHEAVVKLLLARAEFENCGIHWQNCCGHSKFDFLI